MPPTRTRNARKRPTWEVKIQLLESFVTVRKRIPRTHDVMPSDFAIGKWVAMLRRKRKLAACLHPELVARLEQLPGWTWSVLGDQWQGMFQLLQQYIAEKKRIPVAKEVYQDKPLGTWVANQRRRHAGEPYSAERARQLESLPGWSWNPHADRWGTHYVQLQQFQREHGRLPAATDTHGGVRIGAWVEQQRVMRKKGELGDGQCRLLERVPNWTWSVYDAQWNATFARVRDFVERTGGIPRKHARAGSADEKTLARWCAAQRYKYHKKKLSASRAERLDSLAAWSWDGRA